MKKKAFSIYLLKENFDLTNSLKQDHKLSESEEIVGLPENVELYILDLPQKNPWWRDYWGISQNLYQGLKGAIAFINVNDRTFALTFGHTYHYLKEECYEYDFGLKVTLNSVDPAKLKSTDIFAPTNFQRQRIQSPTNEDLTFFDFDRDSFLIKKLTGIVKEEYKDLFGSVTGASNLRITSNLQSDDLSNLCEKILDIYNLDSYKANFPELHNISPVKDPSILKRLNNNLEIAFKNEEINLVLTVPEIIDYQESINITFSGAGKSLIYEDVYIGHYREYLTNNNQDLDGITIGNLKGHCLWICDEEGNKKNNFSLYKCLLFDNDMDGNSYHLCEGNWYKVETNYLEKLRNFLNPYFEKSSLMEYNHNSEGHYNQDVPNNDSSYICLDLANIAPTGQTPIEPCDIYNIDDNGIGILYHIKISTRSSTLSHLFNQGTNSVEIIRSHNESKGKLISLLKERLNGNDENQYCDPINNESLKINYSIISHKDPDKKSDNLPLFSKISLMRSIKTLNLMKIGTTVSFIKDLSEKKSGKEKKKKQKSE